MTESQIASFDDWMHESVKHIEWVANDLLPKPGREPRRLIGAMRYAVWVAASVFVPCFAMPRVL